MQHERRYLIQSLYKIRAVYIHSKTYFQPQILESNLLDHVGCGIWTWTWEYNHSAVPSELKGDIKATNIYSIPRISPWIGLGNSLASQNGWTGILSRDAAVGLQFCLSMRPHEQNQPCLTNTESVVTRNLSQQSVGSLERIPNNVTKKFKRRSRFMDQSNASMLDCSLFAAPY
jgi:hypothetical protein